MKKVKIVIERTSDGYVGYSTGDDLIHGMADTVSECKEDFMNNIESHKLLLRTDQPKWLTSVLPVTKYTEKLANKNA